LDVRLRSLDRRGDAGAHPQRKGDGAQAVESGHHWILQEDMPDGASKSGRDRLSHPKPTPRQDATELGSFERFFIDVCRSKGRSVQERRSDGGKSAIF
ncbi:MAG: hypothetical protein ABI321_18785, partial [Polyangia bacterium]